MRVNTLRIPCTDLAESATYYGNLLDCQPAFGSTDTGYIGFELENVTLLLEPVAADEFESGRYLGFSLEPGDIQSFYTAAVKRGISFTGPPQRQTWGGIMTHVTDCSGNQFSVVQTDEG